MRELVDYKGLLPEINPVYSGELSLYAPGFKITGSINENSSAVFSNGNVLGTKSSDILSIEGFDYAIKGSINTKDGDDILQISGNGNFTSLLEGDIYLGSGDDVLLSTGSFQGGFLDSGAGSDYIQIVGNYGSFSYAGIYNLGKGNDHIVSRSEIFNATNNLINIGSDTWMIEIGFFGEEGNDIFDTLLGNAFVDGGKGFDKLILDLGGVNLVSSLPQILDPHESTSHTLLLDDGNTIRFRYDQIDLNVNGGSGLSHHADINDIETWLIDYKSTTMAINSIEEVFVGDSILNVEYINTPPEISEYYFGPTITNISPGVPGDEFVYDYESGGLLPGQLSAIDRDHDDIEFSIQGGTLENNVISKTGLYGTLFLELDGNSYSYRINREFCFESDTSLVDTFVFTASDGHDSDTAELNIAIQPYWSADSCRNQEPTPEPTPDPEPIAPELLKAVGIDDEIALYFDSELDSSSSPSVDFWTIQEDGRNKSIQSIKVRPSVGKVVFTLSNKIDSLSDITISYNDLKGDQDEGVIQNKDGIDLASIDDFVVDNQTTRASTPLEVLSSEVDGNQIILGFSRELDSVQPRNGIFRVKSDGKKIKIIDIVLDADSREAYLTLKRSVRFDESVSLTYTDADGDQRKNTIQDLDGNDLASLNLELKNTTDRTSVFEVDAAEIDGYLLTLDFAEELDTILPKAKRFKVQVNKRRRKISSLSSSPEDGVVTLELTAPVTSSDDVLISYKDLKRNQASGVIQDLFGNDLNSFKKLVVENTTTDSSSPVLEEAFVEDNLLVMQFDELLSPGIIKSSRIKLTSDGKRVRVKSAELLEADTEVLFKLKKSLPSEVKLLSLDYKDPKRDQRNGVLQDEFGNDFTGVKAFAVEVI